MEIKIRITKIVVITGQGPDKVVLWTTLPPGYFPFKESTTLTFSVAADSGLAYIAENFPGVPVETVSLD